MRLFQPTWRDRDGTDYTSERWSIEFRLGGRRRACRLGLFKDKRASQEAARRIERLLEVHQAGGVLDADLAAWLGQVPARISTYLATVGAIDARWVSVARTLGEHLDDFKAALLARGNTAAWANLVEARARRVLLGCGFRRWSDIAPSRVERFLADLRADTRLPDGTLSRAGMSVQTSNFHAAACKQFLRWAVEDGRVAANPLAHLRALNVRTDRRHDRRALTVDELRWLLAQTHAGPVRQHIHGEVRAMLYRVAAETGLRASELRSLTRASFRLDGPEPSVTVAAGYSKRRREDQLPLRPATALALAAFLATKAPAARAFVMPGPTNVVKIWKTDLIAARQAWIDAAATDAERTRRQQSDFLVYRNDAGKVIDFHALRHTFITNLIQGGANPRTAQTLARHSTITLTMDRYAHTLRGAEAAALALLPDLEVAATTATAAHAAPTTRAGTGPASLAG